MKNITNSSNGENIEPVTIQKATPGKGFALPKPTDSNATKGPASPTTSNLNEKENDMTATNSTISIEEREKLRDWANDVKHLICAVWNCMQSKAATARMFEDRDRLNLKDHLAAARKSGDDARAKELSREIDRGRKAAQRSLVELVDELQPLYEQLRENENKMADRLLGVGSEYRGNPVMKEDDMKTINTIRGGKCRVCGRGYTTWELPTCMKNGPVFGGCCPRCAKLVAGKTPTSSEAKEAKGHKVPRVKLRLLREEFGEWRQRIRERQGKATTKKREAKTTKDLASDPRITKAKKRRQRRNQSDRQLASAVNTALDSKKKKTVGAWTRPPVGGGDAIMTKAGKPKRPSRFAIMFPLLKQGATKPELVKACLDADKVAGIASRSKPDRTVHGFMNHLRSGTLKAFGTWDTVITTNDDGQKVYKIKQHKGDGVGERIVK